MRTKRSAILGVVALAVGVLASSAVAVAGDNQVRFDVLYSLPTGDLVDGGQTTELDEALGFEAAFEFRLSDRLGIEPALNYTSFDLDVEEAGFPDTTGDTSMFGLMVNLNFHFGKEDGLDFFIGPTIGYSFWDDISLSGFSTSIKTDDEFLYGAVAGLDLPLGDKGLALNFGLSYLFVDVSPPGASIGVDPIQFKAGLSYKF